MFEVKGKYNNIKVCVSTIDEETVTQLYELSNIAWMEDSNMVVMPDTHVGKDCVIGFTMQVKDKVCVNLVGSDIGCGMLCVKLSKDLKDLSLKELDDFINKEIPAGFYVNRKSMLSLLNLKNPLPELLCYSKLDSYSRMEKCIGSLGGGNHFIELAKDSNEDLHLIIHSGSGSVGKAVSRYYHNIAKKKKGLGVASKHTYLEKEDMDDYLHDLKLTQQVAIISRKLIAHRIVSFLYEKKYDKKSFLIYKDQNIYYQSINNKDSLSYFDTIHNYIDVNEMILRKGAIHAKKDQLLLIPINMRDGSILARGKGNPLYNESAPHGAGRILSRNESKQIIDVNEFKDTMKDVYTTSVNESTVDEAPFAYKEMDEIISQTAEMIDVVDILKPIYNFKAHDKTKNI